MQQTVLVTGASAGIGKATAIYLAQSGYRVYGAARRVDKLHELTRYGITPITLDVTQDESMTACVEQILREAGRLDVLVNNAGFGSYGALEDVPLAEAKYQLDVNVFGAMRLAQLVLPHMRENRFGKIINVSSVGGKIASPLGGWYHASKFALEALSDALRLEVQSFGINVVVIQPGGTQSEWGSIAVDSLVRVSGKTAYAGLVTAFKKSFEKVAGKVPEPLVIAKLIKTSLEAKDPHTRYSGGYLAKPMLFLRTILSDKLLDRLLLSQFS